MMTAGEREQLIAAIQRHDADVVIQTVVIGLKQKARVAYEGGRKHEAELLMRQGLILLDALPDIRQASQELDSIRLVRIDQPDRGG